MNFLSKLEELISMKTISSDRATCLKIINQLGKDIPNPLVNTENGLLIWGHTDLTTTKWLVNTHLDVVPGKPEQFLLKVVGDKAWGRGVFDVKGCATILISNAQEWVQLAKHKKVTFMLATDEEIGGQGTANILQQMTQLNGAIFLEPSNLHITTQAKGMIQVLITAMGESSHGSRPWDGDNAIEKLSINLALFRMSHPAPKIETKETTFNFSQISGGTAINQVPNSAKLWCDVRFNPQDDPSRISQNLISEFNHCKVEVIKCESPINCNKNSELFKQLSSSLKANSLNPLTQFDHGTSDARHVTALHISSLVFGPKGGNLHADDEWVSLKSLTKVQNVLDHWIKNI